MGVGYFSVIWCFTSGVTPFIRLNSGVYWVRNASSFSESDSGRTSGVLSGVGPMEKLVMVGGVDIIVPVCVWMII